MKNFGTQLSLISFIASVIVIVYLYFLIGSMKRMSMEITKNSEEQKILRKDFDTLLQTLSTMNEASMMEMEVIPEEKENVKLEKIIEEEEKETTSNEEKKEDSEEVEIKEI